MKRKLISYDVLQRIKSDSLSHAQKELVEAESILANALGLEAVKLHCYGSEDVLYETLDGSYVHANYTIQGNQIEFDNVEQVVLNEEDEINVSRKTVTEMVEAVLENNKEKAVAIFNEYVSLPFNKRIFNEGAFTKKSKTMISESKKAKCKYCGDMNVKHLKREKCNEYATLLDNVTSYLKYHNISPILKDSQVNYDENNNVVSLRVPTAQARNEAKLIQLTYKHMLDTDVKVLRSKAKELRENMDFCKAIAELKRHNAMSDDAALMECLENIISKYPMVLYLTQTELAEEIKHALETVNATNYDDTTCAFMAEGILRVAHENYTERVNRIINLSGVEETCEDCDKYEEFQNVVSQFYPAIDENQHREMELYVDLYETFREIHSMAKEENNKELATETARYLADLSSVIQRDMQPSLELVQNAQQWLTAFVETNLETQNWNVSNTPHQTVSGDHPKMAQNARHPYAPASDFSGNWGDSAPVSDGKNYKGNLAGEMRSNAWGNVGAENIWPALQNPYVPARETPQTYKMNKGKEKDLVVDPNNSATGQWGSGDTWPALQNPYVPAAVTPQTYKMNQGKEQDLVVDQ